MPTYLVVFDLKKQVQEYETLFTVIKSLGFSKHFFGSTWLVKSNLPANQVWRHLRRHIDENDSLVVAKISGAVW